MTRYSRKKGNCAPNRSIGKRCLKTKHYKKDTDQIIEEIQRNIVKPEQKRPFEMVDDLPAQGQFFCTECDRFFIEQLALNEHRRSKQHKQRVKELRIPAYSHKESEQAAGMGSYHVRPKNSKISEMDIDKQTSSIGN